MIKKFLLGRLKEPSTWRGLILLIVGLIGYHLSTDQLNALITIALAIVGGIGAFTPDNVSKPPVVTTGTTGSATVNEPKDTSTMGLDGKG